MSLLPLAPRRRDVEAPLVEGTIDIGEQRLGFCEFGARGGRPVFWMHGTPGAKRQLAPLAKQHAADNDIRIIGLDRPGVGFSTPQRYEAVVDFAADVERVADTLGLDRFAVVGLSGGGPYALACAHALGDRVPAVGVLGGVAPTTGEEAAAGGVTALAPYFTHGLRYAEPLLGPPVALLGLGIAPVADVLLKVVHRLMSPDDRRMLDEPGIADMFIDDILRGIRRGGLGAVLQDVVLFGRDWGFRVRDITHRVHWWHGVDDAIIPYAHGEHVARLLPSCTFTPYPGGAHLCGYRVADDALDAVTAEL